MYSLWKEFRETIIVSELFSSKDEMDLDAS